MLGLSPAAARERFETVLEFSELHEFVDLKLKNYSSGMQVRLAFSVAIQVDADVLLIDEVLAVGDAAFQQKCFDEFHRLRDEGKTMLFVTHDMGAVVRFCQRAMLLERGRARVIGEPDEVGEPVPRDQLQPRRGDAGGVPTRPRGPVRRRPRRDPPAPGSRARAASPRSRCGRAANACSTRTCASASGS